ncbi:MAG: amidohydrolase family protein [Acidimicrobiia bacterium]|nr:amidohydrolase family protein [Acidimicrobiia bacterium]
MTYASGRTYYDADSHIMELPNFLRDHADPKIRERVPQIDAASGGRMRDALERMSQRKSHSPERLASLLDLGDGLISGPKGYEALGAFNASERSTALDMLGFHRQWVFTTFSAGRCFDPRLDRDVAVASAAAHNRAMAEFCADDERLLGVGATALDDPDAAMAELDHIIELGLAAVWIPHRTAGGRAPGHDDLDPFWAELADAGLPALLHVGGTNLQLRDEWMNTGRPIPGDWLGGGENVRGKDMVALHQAAETFVGTMVLDGVLERHRGLRVGVIELGAGWVPAMLRRLDQIAGIWKRSEPELAALTRLPSQQITEQMGFTPYPFEDVGSMIREANPDVFLFSSDYPHIEGGRDPLARFSASLEGFDEPVLDRFYHQNMARLIGAA